MQAWRRCLQFAKCIKGKGNSQPKATKELQELQRRSVVFSNVNMFRRRHATLCLITFIAYAIFAFTDAMVIVNGLVAFGALRLCLRLVCCIAIYCLYRAYRYHGLSPESVAIIEHSLDTAITSVNTGSTSQKASRLHRGRPRWERQAVAELANPRKPLPVGFGFMFLFQIQHLNITKKSVSGLGNAAKSAQDNARKGKRDIEMQTPPSEEFTVPSTPANVIEASLENGALSPQNSSKSAINLEESDRVQIVTGIGNSLSFKARVCIWLYSTCSGNFLCFLIWFVSAMQPCISNSTLGQTMGASFSANDDINLVLAYTGITCSCLILFKLNAVQRALVWFPSLIVFVIIGVVFDRTLLVDVVSIGIFVCLGLMIIVSGVMNDREDTHLVNLQRKSKTSISSNVMRYLFHELRVPLSAAMAGIESVKMDSDTIGTENTEALESALFSIDSASSILDNALDLQRMQDGRLRIAVNRTPAKDLLISPIAMMKTFARSKSINIMLHCTDDVDRISVMADCARIHQVVSNLCSNACKYGKGKDVNVFASVVSSLGLPPCLKSQLAMTPTEQVPQIVNMGRRFLLVQVKDEGDGVNPSEVHAIFQPMNRLDKHEGIKGSGLGLPIAKVLVEMHDGFIGVDANSISPISPTSKSSFQEEPWAWNDRSKVHSSRRSPIAGCTFSFCLPLLQDVQNKQSIKLSTSTALPPAIAKRRSNRAESNHEKDSSAQFHSELNGRDTKPLTISLTDENGKPSSPISEQRAPPPMNTVSILKELTNYDIKPTVLLVEDDPIVLSMTSRLLTRKGFKVFKAMNGVQGLATFKQAAAMLGLNGPTAENQGIDDLHLDGLKNLTPQPFDIILLDNHMPEMTGTECIRDIRSEEKIWRNNREGQDRGSNDYNDQPQGCFAVGLTGNCVIDDVQDFKEHGVNEVLFKPLKWEKLEDVLNKNTYLMEVARKKLNSVKCSSM